MPESLPVGVEFERQYRVVDAVKETECLAREPNDGLGSGLRYLHKTEEPAYDVPVRQIQYQGSDILVYR